MKASVRKADVAHLPGSLILHDVSDERIQRMFDYYQRRLDRAVRDMKVALFKSMKTNDPKDNRRLQFVVERMMHNRHLAEAYGRETLRRYLDRIGSD